MTYINTRASGVAGNVTGTAVGSKRALDVNLVTALNSDSDSVSTSLVPAATIGDGTKTATPAYTVTKLYATPTSCQWVTIQADFANTGKIAIGATPTVTATPPACRGVVLEAGDSYTLNGDLSEIYINSTVANERVNYIYGV